MTRLLLRTAAASLLLFFCAADAAQQNRPFFVRGGSTTEVSASSAVPPAPPRCGTEGGPSASQIEAAVRIVWNRHRTWAVVASEKERKLKRNRLSVLYLTVAGAALQTAALAPNLGANWIASMAGGGCLALVPYISSKYLSQSTMEATRRCMAASEALRSEVYTFRAGGAPYDKIVGDKDPIDVLVDRAAGVSNSVQDLMMMYAASSPDNVPPPPRMDREGYITERVMAEVNDNLRKNARRYAQRENQLRNYHSTATSAAAFVGFLAGSANGGVTNLPPMLSALAGQIGSWGAAASTAGAAIAAHIASTKLGEKASQYSATAKRLENLVLRLDGDVMPGCQEWTEFVRNCEEAIAGENQKWKSELAGE